MSSSQALHRSLVGLAIASGLAISASTCLAQSRDTGRPGGSAEDISTMTVEEALSKALALVEAAEEGGPDTTDSIKEAGRLANYVIGQDPLNVRADYVLGRISVVMGRPRDALPRIEKYVNDPTGQTDWKAWKLLGDIYVVSYPKHAESQYKRAVALKETEPEALIGLAESQYARELHDEAVENAQKAIRYDQESKPEYREVLARALLAGKKYDEAIAAAREAVQLTEERVRNKPDDMRLLDELNARYDLLGQCLTTTVGFYPEEASYVIQLSQTMQDKADLERLMAYNAALTFISNAVKNAGENPPVELLWEQSHLCRLTGRNDEAIEALNGILKAEPGNATALEALKALGAALPTEETADTSATEPAPAKS